METFNEQKDNRVIDEAMEDTENRKVAVEELLIRTKTELGKLICLLVRYLRTTGLNVEEDLRERLAELAWERSLEALALLILERIDQQSYSEAKRLICDLKDEEWKALLDEWYSYWLLSKSMDAAILCGIATVASQSTRFEIDKNEIAAMIRSKRPDVADFLDELRNG